MSSPLAAAQVQALADLHAAWPDVDSVLIGATALAFRFPNRPTRDLDLTVSLAVEALPGLLHRLPGWRMDPVREHRLVAPTGLEVDVVPAPADALARGHVTWPRSGFRMDLTGIRLALEHHDVVQVTADLSLRVAQPVPVVVMKMGAYLSRPADRPKDLVDIAHVLEKYPDATDPCALERFSEPVLELDRDFEDAGAILVGFEIQRIANADERDVVRRFLALTADPRDVHQTFERLRGRTGDRTILRSRLEALALAAGL